MEATKLKMLFFSQDGALPVHVKQKLEESGMEITVAEGPDEIPSQLSMKRFDIVVGRSEIVHKRQIEFLSNLRQKKIAVPVLFSTNEVVPEYAVEAMKAGAADVVIEPTMGSALVSSIIDVLKEKRRPVSDGRQQPGEPRQLEAVLIGRSKAMEEVYSAIDLVANSQTAVLITGESGTGKEMVARAIHLRSDRRDKPFVAINCAAFPKDVIENELFGHEKGAFTGALIKKKGCFEIASGGTLFFDEIAEMNPETQAKLLRVIEYKSFRRLGGSEEVDVDVRLVAATNKKIRAALKSGELREDLYYRFSVIEIFLPPLRERKEDIPPLVDHFLAVFRERYGKHNVAIAPDAMEVLTSYDWPGNVRELRNIIERTVVTSPDDVIGVSQLPVAMTKNPPQEQFVKIPLGTPVYEAEKLLILQTLALMENNKSRAARALGVSRKTLYNRLCQFRMS